MMMDAATKIKKARAGLVLDQPFFGSLALRMKPVEDAGCETCWTDGERLGYNPRFVEETPLNKLKGVLAHEVMHCAMDHQNRRGDREHARWNKAGDFAINPLLEAAGISLPDDGLTDPAFAGMSAEGIYTRLMSDDSGGDGDGDGGNNGSQGPQNGQTPPNTPGSGSGGATGSQSSPQGGNQPNNQPQPQGDPGRCGEVRDAPNGGDPSSPQSPESWKIALSQAAAQARAMGSMPGDIAELVDEMLNPKVDWRNILREFLERSAKNDYNWTRPNSRYMHMGLYLPSMISDELPEIVLGIDTSGSIDTEALKQFGGELSGILEQFDTTLHVVYCDTRVSKVETWKREDMPVKLDARGRGGTDFRPVFEWVDEQGLTPKALIYFTDLDGPFPSGAPDYPVLWAKTSSWRSEAPFGDVIDIE